MLFKMLKAERMKLKRSPLWIAFILMPVIPALLGSLNYLGNIGILTSEWFSLWTQHTLFTCYFFLPILLGVYCSFIMHEEENNHNWNKVLTMPVSRSAVFVSKLITASSMILLSEIWIGALFVISGKIIGITAPVPFDKMIVWCLFGTLGGTVMASVQLMISLFVRNFALPVGIALGGGLSGLVFLAKGFGHVWPYSLMAYGMNSNAPQELIGSGYVQFIIICVIYIVLFTIISNVILAKRDI
jgi:hypothetical protein